MPNVGKAEKVPLETAACAAVSYLGPHPPRYFLFSAFFLKGQSKQLTFFVPHVTMLNFY